MVVGVTAWALLSTIGWTAEKPGDVAFNPYRGYVIVVRGEIDGVRNLNFIVDTGAVPSVVDKKLASKLHLVSEAGQLSMFTERMESRRAVARNIRLGPVQATELPVVIQDLSFAENALGTRIDGMIGLDLLREGPFTIDYDSKKINFGPIDPKFVTISYRPDLPYAMVDLDIQGSRIGLLVDTGANDLVLFATALQNCLSSIKKTHDATWSNLNGGYPRHRGAVDGCGLWYAEVGRSRGLHSARLQSSDWAWRHPGNEVTKGEEGGFRSPSQGYRLGGDRSSGADGKRWHAMKSARIHRENRARNVSRTR